MGDPQAIPDSEADAILQALAQVPELKARSNVIVNADPRQGSLAASDSLVAFGPCALMYSSQALQVAADHLDAWRELFATARHMPSFAQMTLLRSVLEAAARSRWLVDQTERPKERAYRGALCQYWSLIELRRFLDTDPESDSTKVRRNHDALAIRMRPRGHKKPRRIIDAELADQYGIGQWAWRYASGYAHASEWAITSASRGDQIVGVRLDQRRIEAGASARTVADLTRLAVDLAVDAHNDLFAYIGGYEEPEVLPAAGA